MVIQKNSRKTIRANDEIETEVMDLLFEAEDVADLVSEVTGEDVSVEASDDGESVTFVVGEDEYTVEAEGNEELVETSKRMRKTSTPVKASKTASGRTVRRIVRK